VTRTEKNAARRLTDEISRNAAALQVLGFDITDIFDTLRDINDALVNMQTKDDLGPLPSFEEHLAYVRQSTTSGAM
jgi:hypothetical protein